MSRARKANSKPEFGKARALRSSSPDCTAAFPDLKSQAAAAHRIGDRRTAGGCRRWRKKSQLAHAPSSVRSSIAWQSHRRRATARRAGRNADADKDERHRRQIEPIGARGCDVVHRRATRIVLFGHFLNSCPARREYVTDWGGNGDEIRAAGSESTKSQISKRQRCTQRSRLRVWPASAPW